MTTLTSVIARIASTIRWVGVAYIAVQVVIWHSFYTAAWWHLAGPVLAMGWAAAAAVRLRRGPPTWQLAILDTCFYVLLALTAGWCVPPGMRGAAASWLFVAVVSQFVVPIWFAPGAASAALALVSAGAYSAGSVLARAAAPGSNLLATTVLLLAAVSVHWCGRQLLYSRAATADSALARADQDARDQYVLLSRSIERREHERLLHDTVLNTLTAIVQAAADSLIGRCQHDIVLLEDALLEDALLEDALLEDALLEDVRQQDARLDGGLLVGLEAVASEMRARGLGVHVEVTRPGEPAASPAVPARVAAAITHAAREALVNVLSHAGTSEAWLGIQLTAAPRRVQVTVRDGGSGSTPLRSIRPGWACAGPSPSGSPTGMVTRSSSPRRVRAPWCD